MLSRTADNLYWMSRYIERAENVARSLDVAHRVSLLPAKAGTQRIEWPSTLTILGEADTFWDSHDVSTEANVIDYMALDDDNPSSIISCWRAARENCRGIRHAVPSEVWQSINSTWIDIKDVDRNQLNRDGVRTFFDWVKERSSLFRGVSVGTMLQDESYQFARLGTFMERGDNTARILDVKYHMLLPKDQDVGGAIDYYQWGALLRSVSAFRNYRAVYGAEILPQNVAEFLILNDAMPRSLHHCQAQVVNHLEALAEAYGKRHECHRLAGETHARFRFGSIRNIFQDGLHEYLTDFIERNARLGAEIADNFLLTR